MFKYLGDSRSVYACGFCLDDMYCSSFRGVQKMRLISGKLSLHSFSSLRSCSWRFWLIENFLLANGEDIVSTNVVL